MTSRLAKGHARVGSMCHNILLSRSFAPRSNGQSPVYCKLLTWGNNTTDDSTPSQMESTRDPESDAGMLGRGE